MNNFSVVSDTDGVAKLRLSTYSKDIEDLSGHTFYIGEKYQLIIGDGNIITIPAEIMQDIGHHRGDGRYAIGVQISFRHVNKKKVVGGGVYKTPNIGKYLEDIPDATHLPKGALTDDPENSTVLVPADIPEFTQSEAD